MTGECFFRARQIGESQFNFNDPQMLQGIHPAGHIIVGKGSQYENDGVDLANVRQERVAETFAVTGALHQPANIGELDRSWYNTSAAAHLRELPEPRIGHFGDTNVGVGRCECVRRSMRPAARECVVQRAFSRVWQPYESESLHSPTLSVASSGTVKAMSDVTSPTRLTTSDDVKSAERAFSRSVFISGIRCGLTYVLVPFVFPLIGFGSGAGPLIGIPVGLAAIVANVVSIRRFHRADHRWKRPMTLINAVIIVMLMILVTVDFTRL